MKFLVISEYAELLDLALALKDEGHEVVLHIPNKEYSKIGDGLIDKTDDSFVYLGKGYVWVFDGCSRGKRQDWLRSKGELVFGGSEAGDKLENDRQLGQKLFKAAGFYQPVSKNFKDIESAIEFVQNNKDKKWILKQNGDAPKSLNHKGKFDGSEDMLFHLEELKKSWNEASFGKVDFDLMEIVEGIEVAASAFFNGQDFLKNKDGKIVGFLNFEEKKEIDGNLGETTGEMGTTFIGVTEDNKLFKDILLRPKVLEALRAAKFRGVFDINTIKTKEGIVALEPTCRFGIPSTSYEFLEGLDSSPADLIYTVASGGNNAIAVKQGFGMVMCIVAKPYPIEADVEDSATSIGERLWILKNGKPIKDFTDDQKKHIRLQNFYKEDGMYRVATKNGYLLTVTATGTDVGQIRDDLINYIQNNLYISGMKYRSDIGERVDGSGKKLKDQLARKDQELAKVKQMIKKAITE